MVLMAICNFMLTATNKPAPALRLERPGQFISYVKFSSHLSRAAVSTSGKNRHRHNLTCWQTSPERDNKLQCNFSLFLYLKELALQ